MDRRSFVSAAVAGTAAAAGSIAAPSIARAQKTFQWKMTNA